MEYQMPYSLFYIKMAIFYTIRIFVLSRAKNKKRKRKSDEFMLVLTGPLGELRKWGLDNYYFNALFDSVCFGLYTRNRAYMQKMREMRFLPPI